MDTPSFLDHIAYRRHDGTGPGLIFLHGYRSDMFGTKAVALEDWAKEWGTHYVRFDMRGHGESMVDKPFSELYLSNWFEDCARVLNELTTGPQILVGSSMGGWMALLLARHFPERVRHVVGVAAAPDFTLRLPERGYVTEHGVHFGDDSFATHDFLADGNKITVLQTELDLKCNVTLLQGKEDDVVPWPLAEEIKSHLKPGQCDILYIEDGDHRLNRPDDLAVLKKAVQNAF